MGKRLGIALALLLMLTLPAAAEMAKGKVKEVDKAGQMIVLEDGTKLWVANNYISELVPGDVVRVIYENRGDKKVVTEIDRRATFMDGTESTNFGRSGDFGFASCEPPPTQSAGRTPVRGSMNTSSTE